MPATHPIPPELMLLQLTLTGLLVTSAGNDLNSCVTPSQLSGVLLTGPPLGL